MRKRFQVVLGLILLASLTLFAAACGGQPTAKGGAEPSTSSQKEQPSSQPTSQPKSEGKQEKQEKFPKEPINLVVTHDAGGGVDTMARGIQPYLEKYLNTTVTVENRPGAGGVIAINYVYKSKNDGYTLLIASNSTIPKIKLNPDSLEFTSIDELPPIASWLNSDGNALAVKNEGPYKTLEDLVAAAQTKTITIALGGGPGSTDHITFLAFKKAYPGNYKFIPFESAEAVAAILGGHVDAGFLSLSGSAIGTNELKLLANTLEERFDGFPEVPTFAELGKPGVSVSFHVGAFAPPGTDLERLEILEEGFKKAFEDPGYQKWAKDAKKPIGSFYGTEKWTNFLKNYSKTIDEVLPELKASLAETQGKK
jgi:tripartite-type tricarboxylate transporter receptor subunit TctC